MAALDSFRESGEDNRNREFRTPEFNEKPNSQVEQNRINKYGFNSEQQGLLQVVDAHEQRVGALKKMEQMKQMFSGSSADFLGTIEEAHKTLREEIAESERLLQERSEEIKSLQSQKAEFDLAEQRKQEKKKQGDYKSFLNDNPDALSNPLIRKHLESEKISGPIDHEIQEDQIEKNIMKGSSVPEPDPNIPDPEEDNP